MNERKRAMSFDTVAELYDRVRPGYPAPIFDAALDGVPAGGRVLEVGCGTGKATRAILARGYRVHAVEPGAHLAAVARRELAGPALEIEGCTFEESTEAAGAYDRVLSAQAFHWVDPAVGYAKAHRALRPDGALALIWNMDPGDDAFSVEVQEIYARYTGPARGMAPPEERCREQTAKIDASGLFGPVRVVLHEFERRFDAALYTDLLGTYSDHMAQEEAARRGLFDGIAELIENRFGGEIVRRYVTALLLAPRR